jgi:putative ABC transport system permease protein
MKRSSISGIMWRTCALVGVFCLLVAVGLKIFGDRDIARLYFLLGSGLALLTIIAGISDYGWKAFGADFKESVRIALTQIRANKLRSSLTGLGVIIGIVAVTLMGTAILGIDAGVEKSLAGFGDDVLYISKWPWRDVSSDWWKFRNRREISADYAVPINEWVGAHPDTPLKLAVPQAEWNTTVNRGEYRVGNIHIIGTTADLARIVKSDMKEGRFFSELETRGARNVVVIGFDVADALFPSESPIDKNIRMGNQQYRVVGVAARQGSFLGAFSWDSVVIMPLSAFRRSFPIRWANPTIRVQVDLARVDEAKEELRGLMRRLRGLGPEKLDDFEINSQQIIRDMIDPIKAYIAIAGLFITGLALFVGAIGIMNITYVSVKERTKEIGTRKALGARRRTILLQFLIEAVSICVLGGTGGLLTAWGLAAVASTLFPALPIVFSLGLVLFGLIISMLTGIFSGFAPAFQASKLDPVVALRYE